MKTKKKRKSLKNERKIKEKKIKLLPLCSSDIILVLPARKMKLYKISSLFLLYDDKDHHSYNVKPTEKKC